MWFKNKKDDDKLIYVRHLDDGANTDQYLRRKNIVQLSEQSLLPYELSKATHGYTDTDTEYYKYYYIREARRDLRRVVHGGDTAQLLLAVYVLVAEEEKGTASIAVDMLDIGRRHVKLCVLPLYPVVWLGQEMECLCHFGYVGPQHFVHWHFDDLLCEVRSNFFCGCEKKRKWGE
jgi:hypothetical protein